MRRLIQLSLIPSLLVALIAGVRAYSQSRPEDSSAILYGLGLCDGKPCFLGIRPGVTTWEEAKKAVLAYYPNATISDSIIIITSDSDRIFITRHKNSLLYAIETAEDNVQLPLSMVIAKMGEPYVVCTYQFCWDGNCQVDFIELFYDSAFIHLNIRSGILISNNEMKRIDFALPVNQIKLATSPQLPQVCLDLPNAGADVHVTTPWLGFASIPRRYLSYAETHK